MKRHVANMKTLVLCGALALQYVPADAAASKGTQVPLGVCRYDYLVYRPEQPFDCREYGDPSKIGDKYNVTFILSISRDISELPENAKKDVVINL